MAPDSIITESGAAARGTPGTEGARRRDRGRIGRTEWPVGTGNHRGNQLERDRHRPRCQTRSPNNHRRNFVVDDARSEPYESIGNCAKDQGGGGNPPTHVGQTGAVTSGAAETVQPLWESRLHLRNPRPSSARSQPRCGGSRGVGSSSTSVLGEPLPHLVDHHPRQPTRRPRRRAHTATRQSGETDPTELSMDALAVAQFEHAGTSPCARSGSSGPSRRRSDMRWRQATEGDAPRRASRIIFSLARS